MSFLRCPANPDSSMRTLTLHAAVAAAALLVLPLQAPAQETTPDSLLAPAPRSAPPPYSLRFVGGAAEERERVAHLLGKRADPGYLLRAPSARTPRPATEYLRIVAPRVETVWNSRIPHSPHDGLLWAGKGFNGALTTGIDAGAGPLRLVVAPAVVFQQNLAFDSLTGVSLGDADRASRILPWHTGAHSVDLPYRFGDGAATGLHPGESSLTLRAGVLEAGAATESQWWGPGVRNAIVLGSNAGGFPHLLLRTSRPVPTPLGRVEARWIVGRLASSPYDTASVGGRRSLSAAALSVDAGGGLTVGAARSVHTPLDGGTLAGDAPGVFLRWRGAGDTLRSRPYQQIASLFGRWVAPAEGVEVYAEWARHQLPTSVRDFLEQPQHTQGYTLGLGWARPAGSGVARLRGEVTYLEQSSTFRARPTGSWYAGRAVPQGYTHRGQMLGAAIGPGASGQWLGAEFIAPGWEVGAGLTRVRWAMDAFYDRTVPRRYIDFDVSMLGSLRVGASLAGMWVGAEWTAGPRYNYLFQNRDPTGWWPSRRNAITPVNHSLRLRLDAAPPRLR
jgi:hypothetical protein